MAFLSGLLLLALSGGQVHRAELCPFSEGEKPLLLVPRKQSGSSLAPGQVELGSLRLSDLEQ